MERVDRDAIVALLTILTRRRWRDAPIPEGTQLWLDVEVAHGLTRGKAHLEGTHSRATFDPIRFDRQEGGFDGTRMTAIVGSEDLDALVPAGELRLMREQRVEVDAEVSGVNPSVDAVLRSEELGFAIGVGRAPLVLGRPSARVTFASGMWVIEELRAAVLGGALTVSVRSDAEGWEIRRARLNRATDLRPLGFERSGVSLDVEVRGTRDELSGKGTLTTAKSELELDLNAGRGKWDGTRVRGRVALEESARGRRARGRGRDRRTGERRARPPRAPR